MIKIKEIPVGYPAKYANVITVRLMPFQTTAVNCSTYYQLFSVTKVTDENGKETETKVKLAEGNCPITNEQYANWGADNTYIEDCVLLNLGLERE